jgi:hypothetical protein
MCVWHLHKGRRKPDCDGCTEDHKPHEWVGWRLGIPKPFLDPRLRSNETLTIISSAIDGALVRWYRFNVGSSGGDRLRRQVAAPAPEPAAEPA